MFNQEVLVGKRLCLDLADALKEWVFNFTLRG